MQTKESYSPSTRRAVMLKAVQFSSLDAGTIASTYDVSTMSSITAHEEHVEEQPPPLSLDESAQDPTEMEEFNVFRDYLGLCDVVMSFLKTVPCLEEPDEDNGPEQTYQILPEQQEGRERRDSLGSAGSDFSSSNSVESVEVADIYYSTYGQGFVSQAFTEPVSSIGSQVFEEKQNGLRPIPPSLLLERNFGTRVPVIQPAKKPQVCLLIRLCKCALKCAASVGETCT